jgi:hypothetical protein
MPDELFYVHSKCCCAPWYLTYNKVTHEYNLVCANCEKPIGGGVHVVGPVQANPHCAHCEQEERK